MDVFINLFHGLLTALQPYNFGIMLTGLAVGVIAGALPGISFVNAMAMALPFTYLMTPLSAMVFLGGIYAGGVFGGSISAILINIPGTPASLPSCWDGYPMTQRGEAARALTLAIAASATGGLVSALLLTFGAPPVRQAGAGLRPAGVLRGDLPWPGQHHRHRQGRAVDQHGVAVQRHRHRQRRRRSAVRPAAPDLRHSGAAERHQFRRRDDRPVRARRSARDARQGSHGQDVAQASGSSCRRSGNCGR